MPCLADLEWPLTVEQIAERWSCTPRWLKELARDSGCGRRAGKRLIFFEDDYEQLKAALPGPGTDGARRMSVTRGPPRAGKGAFRAAKPKKRAMKPPGSRRGKRDYMKDLAWPLGEHDGE